MRRLTSRLLPVGLRVGIRKAYHRARYHVGVRIGTRDPLLPPDGLHAVGDYYVEIGDEFFSYFVEIGRLRPNDAVLDVGCGTGRMARPLTRYLGAGSYDGIDIVAPSVRWCQKAYAADHPNFHFHFTDVYNSTYNPSGRIEASKYVFPFDDASFDFVALTSVFTHMLPRDLENYLREIARVMKPGARCVITYFLLNPDARALIDRNASARNFRHAIDDACRVDDAQMPEDAVAYDEEKVRTLYRDNGLTVPAPVRYGTWCGRTDGMSFQDIVVAMRL